jgi:hypothetical protein
MKNPPVWFFGGLWCVVAFVLPAPFVPQWPMHALGLSIVNSLLLGHHVVMDVRERGLCISGATLPPAWTYTLACVLFCYGLPVLTLLVAGPTVAFIVAIPNAFFWASVTFYTLLNVFPEQEGE